MDASSINELTKHKIENTPNPYTYYLLQNKLVTSYIVGASLDGEGGFIDGVEYWKITIAGRDYIEKKKHDALSFWLPYSITTFIAILSLITSLAEHWGTILAWFSFCNPGS